MYRGFQIQIPPPSTAGEVRSPWGEGSLRGCGWASGGFQVDHGAAAFLSPCTHSRACSQITARLPDTEIPPKAFVQPTRESKVLPALGPQTLLTHSALTTSSCSPLLRYPLFLLPSHLSPSVHGDTESGPLRNSRSDRALY